MTKAQTKANREKLDAMRERSYQDPNNLGCLIYPTESVKITSLGGSRRVAHAVAILSGLRIPKGHVVLQTCGEKQCCAQRHIKIMSRSEADAWRAKKANMKAAKPSKPGHVMIFAGGKMPATSVFTWSGSV